MDRTTGFIRWLTACALLVLLAAAAIGPARAQTPGAPTTTNAPAEAKLTTAQLEQLVAPIALYPDSLLSQVLMASTYPLEVVEAARWSQANPGVSGQALQDAMQKQSWDPSVKGLTAAPQTLQMMSDKISWTQQLGDAVLAQQPDVLAAVQQLRARADAAGNLKSTPQQTVTKRQPPAGTPSSSGVTQVITIESASPDTYYIPIYDPGVVYGAWPWPNYEPFYWYPSGWAGNNVLSFAAGVAVGAAIWGSVDWWRRSVHVNPNRFNQFNRTNIANNTWRHDARHRGNVPYKNADVAKRFNQADRNQARQDLQRNLDNKGRDAGKTTGQGKGQAKNQTKDLAKNQAKREGKNAAHAKKDGQHARNKDAANNRARQANTNKAQANRNHVNRARADGAHANQRHAANRQATSAHAQHVRSGGQQRAHASGGGRGGRRR